MSTKTEYSCNICNCKIAKTASASASEQAEPGMAGFGVRFNSDDCVSLLRHNAPEVGNHICEPCLQMLKACKP